MYIPGWNNTNVKSRVIRFNLYLIILWVTFGTTLKKTIIVKYTLHGQNDSRIWTLPFICMELFFRKHFITLRWWRWFLVCMYTSSVWCIHVLSSAFLSLIFILALFQEWHRMGSVVKYANLKLTKSAHPRRSQTVNGPRSHLWERIL